MRSRRVFIIIFAVLNITVYHAAFGNSPNYSCHNLQNLENLSRNGDVNASYYLGRCLMQNQDKEAHEQAVGWFKLAAKNNHTQAQVYLGHCYYSGVGVEENIKKAFYFYEMAANLGDSWGSHPLE